MLCVFSVYLFAKLFEHPSYIPKLFLNTTEHEIFITLLNLAARHIQTHACYSWAQGQTEINECIRLMKK